MTARNADLTLYGRSYCHLCDQMADALRALALDFRWVDIEDDEVLESRYGELVPVLVGRDGIICHFHFDPEAVRAYLSRIR